MKLSPNSQKIYAAFFQECNLCDASDFPVTQVYSRTGSLLLTGILMVDGITFGRHIFVHPKFVTRDNTGKLKMNEKLLAHELVHVLQYQKLGFLGFLSKYMSDFWRIFKNKQKWSFKTWFESYREIPHEIEARKYASEFINWFEAGNYK